MDRNLNARSRIIELVKQNLHRARNLMQQMANKHKSERQFSVGDFVYLKLEPFRQSSLVQKKMQKLSRKYAGPFQVVKKVGSAAYKLKLPDSVKIHDVFRVSLLKLKRGENTGVVPLPKPLVVVTDNFVPEKILARTFKKCRNQPVTRWLIKWKERAEEDASWIATDEVLLRHPDFHP